MTFKEKLAREHPEKVDSRCAGGCAGCPFEYFENLWEEMNAKCTMNCYSCWGREIPGTEQEAPRTAVNTLKVMLDDGAKMPTRAHSTDAGLDLYAPHAFVVPQSSASTEETIDGFLAKAGHYTVDTGVHVAIPAGYVGMIKSKSGLNVKCGIISEGVIDSGYTGSIRVKLYNLGNEKVLIEEGQKISQLVIMPIITPDLELVDSLEDTERGNGGFGSTGAF